MSPRRNRPKRKGRAPAPEEERPLAGMVTGAPPGWEARVVTAERAVKEYRCPGCDHEIRPGTPHVVAWRSGEDAERRHWHTACWERGRRSIR